MRGERVVGQAWMSGKHGALASPGLTAVSGSKLTPIKIIEISLISELIFLVLDLLSTTVQLLLSTGANWQIGKFIGSYGYTAGGRQC